MDRIAWIAFLELINFEHIVHHAASVKDRATHRIPKKGLCPNKKIAQQTLTFCPGKDGLYLCVDGVCGLARVHAVVQTSCLIQTKAEIRNQWKPGGP